MGAASNTGSRPRGAFGRWLRFGSVGLLAVLLLGALLTRRFVQRVEADFPALGERVELAGLAQHVVQRGAGSPIVFVHGAFGSSHDFLGSVVPALAERHRCVLWDRPGHGHSERGQALDPGQQAQLLLRLIERLELDRPLLVGFSYGGAVALAAALAEPQALRGVVLLNGPSHPWPDPLDAEYRWPVLPVIGPLAVATWVAPLGQLLLESAAARGFAPAAVPEGFGDSAARLALRPASYRANVEDIRALKPFLREQSPRYGELALPLTMLLSEEDRVVSPVLHAPELHREVPRSTLIRVPGAGHQILHTHPDLVIRTIEEAMQRATP